MRVAMWYNNEDVRVEKMPIPQIGPGELLVRVEASGICGTDVLEWYRIHKAPLVLGHEIAGEIIDVGKGIDRFKKDDKVIVAHHVPCNTCHYCLRGHHTVCDTLRQTSVDPGGFAEFIRVPAINVDRGVFVIPNETSFEEASFAEPLACVLRGQRIAGVHSGDNVVVFGSGLAGLLHIQAARMAGASRVIATDISEHRLSAAQQYGADVTIHAEEDIPSCVCDALEGQLADIVIVCTGATSAMNSALRSVDRGGTVLMFAAAERDATIPVSINDLFWRTEITLTSSYAGSPADYNTALEMISSKRLNVSEMITHRLKLAEIGLGFHLTAHPEEQNSLKVIVQPQR